MYIVVFRFFLCWFDWFCC